jgi:RNA polymerase sigma-70 factor (ECF subfamily)
MEALTRVAQRDHGDVIASAAAGDEIAFQQIIAEHQDDMRRVCSYVTRDEAVAEEATYAAWAIVWRKIGSVREPASLRPWLISVAVNEAKRILRKRKRQAEVEVRTDVSGEPGGVDPGTGIASIDLRAAMARLDPDDRALIAMRYGAGFNANELALATGKTPAATRQRLKRLLDRLREDLSHG